MRAILLLAGLLAVGAAPVAAAAQHEAAPAHAAEAPKPAPKAENPAAHASTKAVPAAASTVAPKSELEAAFDRIAQEIEGADAMPGGLRITSDSQRRPAEARATKPRAARAESTPRIHLTWRSAVVWPVALGQAETHDSAPVPEPSRITRAWP